MSHSDIFAGRGTDPDNAAKRLPVALCIDTSTSMRKYSQDLNQAVQLFYQQCANDPKAKNAVEIIAIEFGGEVSVVSAFSEAEYAQIPHFTAKGQTLTASGVTLALDALEARKDWYRAEGIGYYQPILVLMSDGGAGENINPVGRRIKDMQDNRKLIAIPIAFGALGRLENEKSAKNIAKLEQTCGGKKAIRIQEGFSFMEFFQWLSASTSAVATGQDIDFREFTAGDRKK